MPLSGHYAPSPNDFVAKQVAQYEDSDGRDGNTMRGVPVVILWTRGRRSGAIRKTPLMRINDGDRYAVVASQGGAPTHPVWYTNLVEDPHVSLQDGPDVRDYIARTASAEERAQWWPKATAVWPDYDEYQKKTDREIPLVILDPVGTE